MADKIHVHRLAPTGAGGSPDHTLPWPLGEDTQLRDVRVLQVLRASGLLIIARIALVVMGFQRTAVIFNRFCRRVAPRAPVDRARVKTLSYAISMAAAFLPARMLCLERSLVLYYSLRRAGVGATLRLGVRAFPFGAHAWVELDGSPVNDDRDRLKDFNPIFELNG